MSPGKEGEVPRLGESCQPPYHDNRKHESGRTEEPIAHCARRNDFAGRGGGGMAGEEFGVNAAWGVG